MDWTRNLRWAVLAPIVLGPLSGCAAGDASDGGTVSIDYVRHVLDNGLEVILHVDESDPMAAVAVTFHVGSAREVEGRTGFAHLFEHLFFLDSENLGPGGLDRLMTRVGSSTNGSTSRDRTNYYEVVPIDGLEKALWAEADKLGFFINTVTESVVAKEKQVVKNEKRQSVDNRPYGHTSFVIDQALYPPGHPYNWQVIGSLEDLDAATLVDTKEFHTRWYGPNNATLVVAGDIDVTQTLAWVEKYFGEIPARATPAAPAVPAVTLTDSRFLLHEDTFARLPRLTIAWPTVPMYHPDMYALQVLAALLTDGKSTPFYEVLVEEAELAPDVSAFSNSQELAGRFTLQVGAYAGVDLDDVWSAMVTAFQRFEEEGVRAEELERVKAGTETAFYRGLSSNIGKAFQLAQYAIFAGTPGYAAEDLERTLAVTDADILRVYETYLRGRPAIGASFVPQGQAALAVEGSELAQVVVEPIVQGAESDFEVTRGEAVTPMGVFDRGVEPRYGDSRTLRAPEVWRAELDNGLRVFGIEDAEIPLVQFELRFQGGLLLEDPVRTGVGNLLAETMLEGTANRTAAELEQAIDLLGASLNVSAGAQDFVISGSVLARNYDATMVLVEEILLEPRFDPDRFALAKQRVVNRIRQQESSPNGVGATVLNRLLYGDHILGGSPLGTVESVEAIEIDDLQAYHRGALVPDAAAFHVAGAVSTTSATEPLSGLAQRWVGGVMPEYPPAPTSSLERAGLYFVDVPGSAQSVIGIGRLALREIDDGFYPATVMNFRLGGGGFAADLTQTLREGKGYTYGIASGFQGTQLPGPFTITSSVRSNVTLESLALIKDIVERHGPEFDAEDLAVTKGFLLRANALAFETLGAKLGILRRVSAYGFSPDYVLQREQIVRDMTIEHVRSVAAEHLDPAHMIWLVVGDAETQRDRLTSLGLGEPVTLDREGRR